MNKSYRVDEWSKYESAVRASPRDHHVGTIVQGKLDGTSTKNNTA